MYESVVLNYILEIQLTRLKTSAQWWIGAGVILMALGGLLGIINFELVFLPINVLGALVMLKGIFLFASWARINREVTHWLSPRPNSAIPPPPMDAPIGIKSLSPQP